MGLLVRVKVGERVERGQPLVEIHHRDGRGLDEAVALADRILVMRDGHVAGEFLRGEATEQVILDCALRGGPTRQGSSPAARTATS